jgi:hypothetical protein
MIEKESPEVVRGEVMKGGIKLGIGGGERWRAI